MLGLRRTAPLALSIMATNIEQIFRDFVMNKIKEIEDEGQHSGVTSEGHPDSRVPHSLAKAGKEVVAAMEGHQGTGDPTESAGHPQLEDTGVSESTATADVAPSKEGGETPRKKNKKHKRHKSKKKKKKRKEEKESSSESGVESGGETQARVKNQTPSSKDGPGGQKETTAAQEPAGNVPAAGQPMEEGDGKTKKHKRHMAKKKKKKKKKEEEKQEKKSPSRSRSESTSASGSESDSEQRPLSKLPPASSPVLSLSKNQKSPSPTVPSGKLQERMSPVHLMQEVEPIKCNLVFVESLEDDFNAKSNETCLASIQEDEKVTSNEAVEVVSAKLSDVQGNFSAVQDLPDIIPKLESAHKEEPTKANVEAPAIWKGNKKAECEEKLKSHSESRSKSRSRSSSKLTSMVPQGTPFQRNRSRSRSQKQTSDKQDSHKARSSSRRRSTSTSKRRSSPRKKKSRSRSGRHRSRSPSIKRSGRKSRSLSAKRQKRSDSRSRIRNRKSRSRSGRRTRSRSIVRRRRSHSRSLSRRRKSRSRSKRSRSRRRIQRSRSARRGRRSRTRSRSRRRRSVSRSRRSVSRSIRRTRRTRSRSIVILRRSRSRSLLRKNRRSKSKSVRRRSRSKSIKRQRSRSRSVRRSKRSRSRSPARRRRSKTPSPRRSQRSKSQSLSRRHRSRSDSHKGGRKQSQSPKRNRRSKSRSPTRNKSKSRSVSEVRSSKKSPSSAPEKAASKSGTSAKESYDTCLLSTELESKGLSPEQPREDDEASKEMEPQILNSKGCTIKEEAPANICADENSTDNTAAVSFGSWRPVPFLVDSSIQPDSGPAAKGINSSASAEEAAVTEPREKCKSPQMSLIEKCFTPEMPLAMEDIHSDSPSQATSKQCDLERSDHLVSAPEGGEHLSEFRYSSISPQPQKTPESMSLVKGSSLPEESDLASSEALKLEPRLTFPPEHRTRSQSPADGESSQIDRKPECIRSHSASKEVQTPAEKMDSEPRSPSLSKRECSSKQGPLSASASPVAKKRSVSRSSRRKKSKSKSPIQRKHSRSSSSSRRRRSQSKSTSHRKKSKSRSPSRKRKSRSQSRSRKRKSKSPPRRRRSRSKSPTKRKKSRSKSTSRSTKRKRSKSRSPGRKKRSKSRSPRRGKRSKSRSPVRRKRSKSAEKSKHSKSRSPARKRRSRSRSTNRARRSHSRRSRSLSRRRRGGFRSRSFDRRDRWRREPSHSPILILRKKRSSSRTRRSTSKTPPRLTDLDKDQLLEIAKANAAAMCAKAGMPIPESLRPKAIHQLPLPTPVPSPLNLPLPLPMNLPMGMPMGMPNISMNAAMATMTAATMTAALTNMGALASMPGLPALPSITNKPPPTAMPNTANIEEVKRKVTQKANSISIKELTEKCKMIAESKEEMAVAQPHVSDDEEEKPFGGGALRENKGISFSLSNPSAKPATRTEAAFAKEFPVSSGSQHRKRENDGAYGEWVPMDRKTEKEKASVSLSTGAAAEEEGKESDSIFPDTPLQPVDITLAVSERAVAQKRLAENPFDVNAICMLSRAQEQVDAWAQSNSIPGLFTGSTGAQVLSSEELSNSGPQAWVKKDQFLKAAPVSGGVGEFLMRKMGWRAGEGLGKHREGAVEPIVIDFKTDRKGLVAEGEKMQKSGSLVVMKDLLGKHPVSALMEICNKKKWAPPEFVMVHHSGPDHRKNFLFKVVVNGTDYQPQTASPNKKHAKAMAATVALQAMGEVSGDSLHTGPVFTAATSTN